MATAQAEINAVIEALNDNSKDWYTIRQIAERAGLPVDTVLAAIETERGKLVRSANKTKSGENLYSLRDIYEKKAPFYKKVLGSLKNRVD
ncbi:MAG TPA: hypothetical protein VF721_18175 [Pyrinomonadaceae bacterium]|jgi:hypothetical protein